LTGCGKRDILTEPLEENMRTFGIFSLFMVIVFSFFSCEIQYYPVTVRNNSSKQVTYTYDDITDTLAVSDFREYQVKAHAQAPENISVPGTMSVTLVPESSGEEYIFTDISPLDLYVLNTLDIDIILTADNYIDNNGETSLGVNAKSEITTAKIYTQNPKFTISSGYSPSFIWEIKEETMYVTIK
jgi:hypothetical protein